MSRLSGESKSRVYGRKETQRVAVMVGARDQPRASNGRLITRPIPRASRDRLRKIPPGIASQGSKDWRGDS